MLNTDFTTPLSQEEIDARLDTIARQIVGRRLETPAAMFLEMHKPLSYLASQGLIVAMPMLGPFVGHQNVADFSKILSNSANVERLIQRIEELAEERDEAESKPKPEAKTEAEAETGKEQE